MSQAHAKLIASLKHDAEANTLEIPSLPEVVLRINAAIEKPEIGITEVARLIQLDPVLTARLLKIANSPLYRRNLELIDVKYAIQRLGLRVTRNIVTSLVMHNIFKIQSNHLLSKVRELWQHSCRVAAISQVLARLTPGLQADRALLAGLLHDIGVLPVLVYADRYATSETASVKLDEIIQQMRVELGEKILQQWQLGDDLCMVPSAAEDWQREHAGGVDYGDLVQVAQLHSYYGVVNSPSLPPLVEVPAFNKMSLASMGPHAGIELLAQAKNEITATIRMLNNQAS